MNKDIIKTMDLVKSYHDKYGISYKKSKQAIDNVFDLLKDELQQGKDIKVKGLGFFRFSRIAPRKMFSKLTKKEHEIPETIRLRFSFTKSAKDYIFGKEK